MKEFFKKAQTWVLVFSALTSTYVAVKNNPEIVDLIKSVPSLFKK